MSEKEGRYYVEYLGWKESRGLYGREFTEPVITELLARRRNLELPKMTVKVSNQELLISQEVQGRGGGRPEKSNKYPSIPIKDVSFVIQGLYPDGDVVACIFLGYNPYTKCAIHVHVYRFDSEATAAMFVSHVNSIISNPTMRSRIISIEKDLSDLGHVVMRQQLAPAERKVSHRRYYSEGSEGASYGMQLSYSPESLSPAYSSAEEALKGRTDIKITKSRKPAEDQKAVRRNFRSLHEELEYKMNLQEPILLPPKDYDTIFRRHGRLGIRDEVKRSSQTILGPNGVFGNINGQSDEDQVEKLSSENALPMRPKTMIDQNANITSTMLPQSNGHHQPPAIVRSQSDNMLQFPLHRQNSVASSDRSNNSDEMFADGLYQGYRPRKHARSQSKENGKQVTDDLTTQMAMWSPSYSFGQTGIKSLPTHHEEDTDLLNRTAPAGSLVKTEPTIPTEDYHSGGYSITPIKHIKRSNSQKF